MTELMIILAFAAVSGSLPVTAIADWPSLLTWAGLIIFGFVSVIRGWLVPKSSHEREIDLLKAVITEKERRIVEVVAEKDEWRAASLTDQAVAQETRAQHRLLLETQRSTTYALEQVRTGLEAAAKEGT